MHISKSNSSPQSFHFSMLSSVEKHYSIEISYILPKKIVILYSLRMKQDLFKSKYKIRDY